MSRTGKFIAGAILGAAATALLTPVSGKKMRAKINSSAKKAGIKTDKYEAKLQTIVEEGAAILQKLTAAAGSKKADGRSRKKKK